MGFEVQEQTYLQIGSLIETSELEEHKIEDFFFLSQDTRNQKFRSVHTTFVSKVCNLC